MDVMSSSVTITSIEGHNYGLKDKCETNEAARKWICYISDIRAVLHVLTRKILIQDNARGLKSADLKKYIESLGVIFFSAYEQHQNGLAESLLNSIMLLNRTQMAESGPGSKGRALVNANDARNVIYHDSDSINTTPHYLIHGEPKSLSKFRAFWCLVYPYLTEDCHKRGKHKP